MESSKSIIDSLAIDIVDAGFELELFGGDPKRNNPNILDDMNILLTKKKELMPAHYSLNDMSFSIRDYSKIVESLDEFTRRVMDEFTNQRQECFFHEFTITWQGNIVCKSTYQPQDLADKRIIVPTTLQLLKNITRRKRVYHLHKDRYIREIPIKSDKVKEIIDERIFTQISIVFEIREKINEWKYMDNFKKYINNDK